MAPESKETERTLYLRELVEAAATGGVLAWPEPTNDDLISFANIISLNSEIEFALRYVVELMDNHGMLPAPWKGKKATLNMYRIVEAIRSSDIWIEEDISNFEQIELHRPARVVAHFIVRRIPTEDAFIFMTMSPADYELVFGVLPEKDSMLYGIADAAQMRATIPILQVLVSWCSRLPLAI
jgi:hypothetical protein